MSYSKCPMTIYNAFEVVPTMSHVPLNSQIPKTPFCWFVARQRATIPVLTAESYGAISATCVGCEAWQSALRGMVTRDLKDLKAIGQATGRNLKKR